MGWLPGEPSTVESSHTATGAGPEFFADTGERFAISVDLGGATANVELERQLDNSNWRNVEQYTANTEKDGIAACRQKLRLRVSSYTGPGTVTCRLQK